MYGGLYHHLMFGCDGRFWWAKKTIGKVQEFGVKQDFGTMYWSDMVQNFDTKSSFGMIQECFDRTQDFDTTQNSDKM